MELKRRCPGCGAPLPEEASFCPFCASSVNQRTALEPPSLRRLLLLRLAALLAALAAAALALFLLTRPRTFDGQGEVVYTDGDGSYQLVLGAAEDRYAPVRERRQNAAVGEEYRFPVYLYVNHTGSGADAGQLFLRKVASVEAELLPVEEGVGAVSCTQPAPDDYFPGAALVSYVDYTARDAFTTQLVLTLTMDNGDEVRLRQDLHVTPIRTYEYRPGDVPMDTLADLQALVDEIAATVEPSAQVDLYLPPVTYEGSLVMEERPVNLYGSEEDGRRTAFTGTLRVASRDSWIVYVKGIDFVGDGSGVGISASARLWVEECSFTGWKTGVLGYGDAWVNVMGCAFTGNRTGFHFNSEGATANDSRYVDNLFQDNDVAVKLERVPTNVTLNFGGSVFSGNGTDIENTSRQPIDITMAVFE